MTSWPAPDPATRISGNSPLWLPSFDAWRRCSMCGFDIATTRYDPRRRHETILGIRTTPALVRTCLRCRHIWYERPLG